MGYRRAPDRPHPGYVDDELVDWGRELFGPEPKPFYQRTGILLAFAAIGLLALIGVGVIALVMRPMPATNAAGHTPVAIPTADLPTASVDPTADTLPPVVATTSHAAKTSTTTTTAPTTTVPTAEALPSSGRFSGTISAKSGDSWTITDWQGSAVQVKMTPATQYTGHMDLIPRPQFVIGQTVSVFWHVDGDNNMVVDRIYGLS